MKHLKYIIKNLLIVIIILSSVFILSLCLQTFFGNETLIPTLFVLGVFIVALTTSGYYYGIISALISVLAVNFAFTFPYFAFNFSIYENILSAVILILITTLTSMLTTKIKENERARSEAEKERMRADLLRAVSHDLRTPLTTIYGASSTLLDNFYIVTDDNKIDILNGIQKDSQWLIRMVENLLSITKLDNSKIKLVKFPIVPEELIDSVLGKFKKNYPTQKVELILPDDFIMMTGDALLLEQVLLNLLENAVHHACGMTKLSIKVYVHDDKVYFEVIDNGCGIDKERLKNIFTGYYMNEKSIYDNQKKCMGIGLSVCAAIIKAHGGKIQAENRKEGGMIFRFSLDIVQWCDVK